jgi:membrane-bound lytic murein transglycosylase B
VQGSFIAMDVFISQIAYLAAGEQAAFDKGDYRKDGAMSRTKNQPRVQRRRRYAVKNVSAILRYAKKFSQDPRTFKGSWAGAIGLTQFMPASLKWAKDGDGDGKVDLSTIPDAVASTANYLVEHGYVRGDKKARRAAFRAYNPNSEYVSAIYDYAERFKKRRR